MNADDIIDIVLRTTPENGIEILASEISELKETLETLEAKQKELMEEVGEGFITSRGRTVLKRSRTTNKVDLEMFFLTDKDIYLEFANQGKLTVPASCIKELDPESPYISQSVTEYYTLKGDLND